MLLSFAGNMQELLYKMFVPEYSITNNILKNIAIIEYCKAIVDNTTILDTWQTQLQKEAELRFITSSLQAQGLQTDKKIIKKTIDGLKTKDNEYIEDVHNSYKMAKNSSELNEETLKTLYKEITQNTKGYRSTKKAGKTPPEEILAQIVELIDWYDSLDSKETHPIIRAGILKSQLEQISPFERYSNTVTNLATMISLRCPGYYGRNYICFEDIYTRSNWDYEKALCSIQENEGDITEWLEYFTGVFANEITNVKEKVLLLARDTKIAKASGNLELTARQGRIVEYLQDYGMFRNKDFSRVFPDISEDSVLRDLKVLVTKGIVAKRGKTKNSRYELK